MEEETNENKKWPKKKLIKAIVTLVIIALLIISIVIFVKKNNAEAQIDRFSDSIKNSNENELAEVLSTNDRRMTTKEAKSLIAYLKTNENPKRLSNTLNKVKKNLKSGNSTSELGTLKDKYGKPVLSFSKNGKHLFLLDKISIKPYYRDVYIKELNNSATYSFSKDNQVAVDKNKTSKIGSFVVGDYVVPVKKKFEEGSVKGKVAGEIHINTDKVNDKNKIVAEQNFNQTEINVKLHNDDKLENGSKEILINGEPVEIKEGKPYGYFPNEEAFSVEARGELEGHRFSTNKVEVLQGTTTNSTQVVNLNFDSKAIDKAIKIDKENKKKLDEFIKSYMKDLNKAYKNTEYDEIADYIEDDSSAEKFMKPKFKHKQSIKYTDTKLEKIKKEGNIYKLYVNKKYKNFDVNNIYQVKIENGEPKIVKIEDD